MASSLIMGGNLGFLFFFFISSVCGQSIQGASFFGGNGAPGAGSYSLIDDYDGASNFFDKFNYYSSYDPTYGHVQYVNQSIADRNNFTTTSNQGTAVISVDTTNPWPTGGPGRPSVRIISDNTYTHGLFILDLLHLPWGCGVWPAYWLLGPDWPSNGEIDIIEGVNTIGNDSVTLHTTDGCVITGADQTGQFQSNTCSGGCGSVLNNTATPNNYGSDFNNNGGGVYATEWTSDYIKTWFFPRDAIPASITSGSPDPNSDFGIPAINSQGCPFDQHFNNMSIIINTDFCGAWAGNVYRNYPSCPQNASAPNSLDACVDFVGLNPSYFKTSYWEIRSIKVYQMPPGVKPTSSYSTSLSSTQPLRSTETVSKVQGATTSNLPSSPYSGPLSSTSSASPSSSVSAGNSSICSIANGTIYTDDLGQKYRVQCGFDYNGEGATVPVQRAATFEDCLEFCDSLNGCRGVSFVAGNNVAGSGTCYPKAGSGAFVSDPGTDAALRVAGPVTMQTSSASSSDSSTPSINMTSTSSAILTSHSANASVSSISSATSSVSSSVDSSSSSGPTSSTTSSAHGTEFSTVSSMTMATSKNNSSSNIAHSSSQTSTSGTPSTNASSASSVPSGTAPPCPTSTASFCTNPNNVTTCSSTTGQTYQLKCGIEYEGQVVQPVIPSNSSQGLLMNSTHRLTKRDYQPSLQACQTSCYDTPGCIALNYQGKDCTLFKTVSGVLHVPGAVAGSVVPPHTSSTVTITPTTTLSASTTSLSSGATVTVRPTSTILSTISPQHHHTSTAITYNPHTHLHNTHHLHTTFSEGDSGPSGVSLCFTCALTPTIVSGGSGVSPGSVSNAVSPASTPVCTALPRHGTMTIFNTYTITSCPVAGVCPALGYVFGGNATQSGATVVTTTDRHGHTVTYTQIPASGTGSGETEPDQGGYGDHPGSSGYSGHGRHTGGGSPGGSPGSPGHREHGTDSHGENGHSGQNGGTGRKSHSVQPDKGGHGHQGNHQGDKGNDHQHGGSPGSGRGHNGHGNNHGSSPGNSAHNGHNRHGSSPGSSGHPGNSGHGHQGSSPGTNVHGGHGNSPGNHGHGGHGSSPGSHGNSGHGKSPASNGYGGRGGSPSSQSRGGHGGSTSSNGHGGSRSSNGHVHHGSTSSPAGYGGRGTTRHGGTRTSRTGPTTPANTIQPTCPVANDSAFTSPMGMQYSILCGTAFSDRSVNTQTQSSFGSCIAACDMYNVGAFMIQSPCMGVTYFFDKSSDNCELKAGSTGVARRGAESARLLTPHTGSGGNKTSTIRGSGHGTTLSNGQSHASRPTSTTTGALTTVRSTHIKGGSTYLSTRTIGGSTSFQTIVNGGHVVSRTLKVPGSTRLQTYTTDGHTTVRTLTISGSSTIQTYTTGGSTTIRTHVVGGSTVVGTYTTGGSTGVKTYVTAVPKHVSTYVVGGSTELQTYKTGGTTGVKTHVVGGSTFLSTYTTGGSTSVRTQVVGGSTRLSTYTSGGSTIVKTHVVGGTTRYTTLTGHGATVTGTNSGNAGNTGPGQGAGTGPGTGPGTRVTTVQTTAEHSRPYTIERVVTTYVSYGVTYTTTYFTTEYLTSTKTSVSVSISASVSTETASTITLSGTTVTQTPAPGEYITVTEPPTTIISYIYPSSSKSTFTCRTYATNYLNGNHGRVKRMDKRGLFDGSGLILFGEMGVAPQPGAVPKL